MKKQRLIPLTCLTAIMLFSVSIGVYGQRGSITLISPHGEDSGYFGWSVSGAGDVNNDGYDDVIVGAYRENPATTPNNAGRAYIFSGADSSLLHELISPNEAINGSFGYSVAGTGDINGDAYADVIVGAYFEDGGELHSGRAYVFNGVDGSLLYSLISPNPETYGYFGWSVSGGVDTNNDNIPDIIVGALLEDGGVTDAGRAYIFSGLNGSLLATLESPNAAAFGNFARSVSGLKDVNGDGHDEVLVGAFFEDDGALKAGKAYVFSGVDGSVLHSLVSPNAKEFGYFGWSVSDAGDLNNDGINDVVISAVLEDSNVPNTGRVHVFNGGDGSPLYTFISPNGQANTFFGWSVSGAGDLNRDGHDEIIVGASFEDGGTAKAGRAYIFNGLDGSVMHLLTSPHPENFGYFGWSVSAAGDVDNDGRDDVVVGALFENGGLNDAGRAYMFVYRPPVPQGFFLLANEEIEFEHHFYSEGKIHSNGNIEFDSGSPSTHAGNVIAVTDIEIARGNTIKGDITAGGEVENKGIINGTITQNANVAIQLLPEILSFSPGTQKIKVPRNGTFVLPPGQYGKVDVGSAATLYLSSGEYNLVDLELGTAAILSIDVSAGPATVNLVEEIEFDPGVTMEITGDETGFPSARVTFNSTYPKTIKIRRNSIFLGTLNAPYAKVKIQEDAFFKGAISAREIEIEQRVTAVFHTSEMTPHMESGLAKTNQNDNTVLGFNNLPVEYELSQNYPNPFNPSTTIRLALPEAGRVSLTIYNIQGQLVRTLSSGYYEAGYHQFRWDATNDVGERVASGFYFYRLRVSVPSGPGRDFHQVKKMLLLK